MEWKRASGCAVGECVEVAVAYGVVAVRNSAHRDYVVFFEQHKWAIFLAAVRAGEFQVDTAANVS